jgi:hypothetical protein
MGNIRQHQQITKLSSIQDDISCDMAIGKFNGGKAIALHFDSQWNLPCNPLQVRQSCRPICKNLSSYMGFVGKEADPSVI